MRPQRIAACWGVGVEPRTSNARQANEIREKGFDRFGETKRGNFVIVDSNFTNDSSEAVTLDSASVALVDSSGNKSEADPDTFGYIPANKEILLENVNPGVTRPGKVIFTVAHNASGFKRQVGAPTRSPTRMVTSTWASEHRWK